MAQQSVCTACGYVGSPKSTVKGSFGMEVVLWLFFLVPGIIYSIWRLTSRHKVCPKCKQATMIPTDTPIGAKLLKEHEAAQKTT